MTLIKLLFLLNGNFLNGESAEKALANGDADAIVFGRMFISNPDLVYKLKHSLPLEQPNPKTFYSYPENKPEVGYTDYPKVQDKEESEQFKKALGKISV
jgi:2,4-dienoyl-CoA reductase-like NADH-dependent reductase (Old Yellow Enzyme family)